MTSVIAYIGLGSNLSDPQNQLNTAHRAIAELSQVTELNFSSLYHSSPMGSQDQPDYVNAVMGISTTLPALDLLRCLQAIEKQQGRVRNEIQWSARTLDLDILLYGEHSIVSDDLTVPHPGIAERAFVLYPLQEIAPTLNLQGLGSLADLITRCPLAGLKKLT